MNAVKQDVEKLVQKELESANRRFPMFRSDHEGYAVIKEEIEESEQALENTKVYLNLLWIGVKENLVHERNVKYLKRYAEDLACEAIQVTAMAQKFIDSQKEREKSEGNKSE